jgi:hypothetical protein
LSTVIISRIKKREATVPVKPEKSETEKAKVVPKKSETAKGYLISAKKKKKQRLRGSALKPCKPVNSRRKEKLINFIRPNNSRIPRHRLIVAHTCKQPKQNHLLTQEFQIGKFFFLHKNGDGSKCVTMIGYSEIKGGRAT